MSTTKKATTTITVLSFLILEVLAFVGFSLGNSFTLYAIFGTVSLLMVIFLTAVQFKKEGLTSLALFLVPLFIFGLLTVVSGFSGYFDLTTNLFVPIGFIAFGGLGYCLNQFKEFKLKYAFIAIYGGLALLTLISFIYNMIQFVPFYTIIYKNSYLIYDGMPTNAPIGETAYFLMGFSFVAVSVEFFAFFPTMLATSALGLFFINPRKEKYLFTIYAVFALIGILPLILMPTIMTVISTFGIAVISLIVLLHSKGKIKGSLIKDVFLIGLVLFALLFIFAVLNANLKLGFVDSNPLLNKIFNSNRLASGYNFVLGNIFKPEYFLGYHFQGFIDHGDTLYGLSNCWLFDNFIYSGVIGFIVFAVFIYALIRSISKFVGKEGHNNLEKTLILCFVLAFFLFTFITYDPEPYVNYGNFIPYYMNGPFLLVLFLAGYSVNNQSEVKEEVIVKQPEENMVETIEFMEVQ